MKKNVLLLFFVFLSFIFISNLQAEDEASNSNHNQKEIEQTLQDAKQLKKAASALNDPLLLDFIVSLEQLLDLNAKCFDKNDKDELKAGVCIINETKKLAKKGNVVAEHSMGNIYEEMQNYPKAIQWYQRALDNPKLPALYKPEIQSDMDRAKAKQKK